MVDLKRRKSYKGLKPGDRVCFKKEAVEGHPVGTVGKVIKIEQMDPYVLQSVKEYRGDGEWEEVAGPTLYPTSIWVTVELEKHRYDIPFSYLKKVPKDTKLDSISYKCLR